MAEPDIVGKGSRSEILMGFGVMALLFVLVIPLPGFMIDGLIAVNLAVATLVMLITLAAREPLELSTYPTILLLTTLFRLALNVASSRMILLKGDAGDVIHAFGMFVVGGDLVVGITIFAIIIIIQFVVITKGSSRISEVAARFTLDAMPGKQMAIDADLTAGTITESEARTRREKVGQEAEFYGAMDGAGKFVRGDAVAGLIITVVNIVGGATIGMLEKDLGLGEALKKYAILTIGDGLVTQTPALIIAVASGMLVTKTSSKEKFADEFGAQMTRDRRAMGISAAVVSLLAFLPGFPALPFLTMGGILAAFWRGGKVKTPAEAAAGEDAGSTTKPETGELTAEALTKLLQVDRLGVEVGFRLISMVDGSRPGGLLDHIASVRRQFAQSHGIIVPPIRLKDNITMEPNAYRILIAGQEVARGTIYPNNFLAMNPGHVAEAIAGVKTVDPTFGLPAVWVRDDKKVEAEALGYTVVDANTVLVTHLSETLKSHAHEILTRDDVGALIDKYKAHSPAVVTELIPEILHLGDVQRVLQNLLLERIPVRNLGAILECLADNGRKVKDVDQLTELVRQRIGRTLCELVQGRDGILRAIVVDPEVETHIDDALAGRDGAEITPDMVKEFQESAAKAYVEATRRGFDPFVLVRATIRRYAVDLLSGASPRIPVLSFGEVSSARQIEPCGQISFPVESRKLLGAMA